MAKVRRPNGWTILKFTANHQVLYKIFATWRWGNEEWMLSSGAYSARDITEDDANYIWPQTSGSIYYLPKDGQRGFTFYQGQVLEGLITKANDSGASVEIVKLQDILQLL